MMAIIYETEERKVIPNWRDYKRTIQFGELGINNKNNNNTFEINIDRIINDWITEKNIGTAAELVGAAFISGKKDFFQLKEAIDLIRNNSKNSSSTLLELIEYINIEQIQNKNEDSTKFVLEEDLDTIDELQAYADSKKFFKLINGAKERRRLESLNPIVWVELARLYTMSGLEKKAERSLLTALHLAPNNRFVLRSATRFFIHTNQFDKALFYLKKSNSLKYDPWLISAHIATSATIGRFSPLIKNGEILITSNNFSPFELTELCSSLGTLEFFNGTFKKAKKLFNQSMIQPNDNSLAQMEWISKKDSRFTFNPFIYESVINPFEAYALDYFENENWKESFSNCLRWLLDMPFSKKPILLGSYLAGSLLKDKKSAITLCEIGLKANPHDPTLLNNIVYELATSGNLKEAIKYFNQIKDINLSNLTNESKITIQATSGLISIRNNEFTVGKKLYELAIENSKRIKNEYLSNLAILNYTRELCIAKQPEKDKYLEIVTNMVFDNKHKDLVELKKDVLGLQKV